MYGNPFEGIMDIIFQAEVDEAQRKARERAYGTWIEMIKCLKCGCYYATAECGCMIKSTGENK